MTDIPTPEERAAWRRSPWHSRHAPFAHDMILHILDAVDALEAERDEAREWLRENGQHTSSCACVCYSDGMILPGTCTCGLDDLIVCGRGRLEEEEP